MKTPKVSELTANGVKLATEVKLRKRNGISVEELSNIDYELNSRGVLIQIPHDDLELRRAEFTLYKKWRYALRTLFESYLSRGYIVTDFISELRDGFRENFYLLI